NADRRVVGLDCVKLDDKKQPIPGSEHTVPADLVLLAIGQSRLFDAISGLEGVVIDGRRLVVDEHGAMGRPGFYAGGDLANGGKEVVNAVYEGRVAAEAMHAYLMNGHAS